MRLTIASRKSDLARLQAYQVGDALCAAHPHLEIDYHFRASLGDQNQQDPLWKMPERGVFTEDFVGDLISGRFDLVVHSWKDLPLESRPETEIAATLKRADQRDLLLVRKDRWAQAHKSKRLVVLSSSPRREYNLTPFLKKALPGEFSEIRFENVRGNVPTRIQKLLDGDADALVLAKAALDRLMVAPREEFRDVQERLREYLAQMQWMVLPLSQNPTAAAQGALAVEIRTDRDDLRQMLLSIHDARAFQDVIIERQILGEYGGGCHQKIGVSRLTRAYGSVLMKKGLSDKGHAFHEIRLEREVTPAQGLQFWPQEPEQASFFERVSLEVQRPQADLFIARADALPVSWEFGAEQLVWCAGVKTWAKLAARGIWVHGTCDGLGEREPRALEALLGRAPQWVKLTHLAAPEQGPSLATYELKPKLDTQAPSGYTHYYWMSGSQFDRAVELDPEILKASHSCGPGWTFEHIQKRLTHPVSVYLSFEEWKKEMLRANT